MYTLENKVVLITGAAQGIGKAIALKFLNCNAVAIIADINADELHQTQKELSEFGNVFAYPLDVTDAKQVQQVIQTIATKHERIDVLVNNAGILKDASLLKMTEEQFDQVIDVNLKGVFLCGQACAKLMKEKKSGTIINISSTSYRGNFGQTNYSAAKAGVVGMTKTWALELSKYNIHVNAIAPGFIATDMTASIPQDIQNKMIESIPLKRIGQPQDIANLAAFLASDGAAYIQGEVISANGGFLI